MGQLMLGSLDFTSCSPSAFEIVPVVVKVRLLTSSSDVELVPVNVEVVLIVLSSCISSCGSWMTSQSCTLSVFTLLV